MWILQGRHKEHKRLLYICVWRVYTKTCSVARFSRPHNAPYCYSFNIHQYLGVQNTLAMQLLLRSTWIQYLLRKSATCVSQNWVITGENKRVLSFSCWCYIRDRNIISFHEWITFETNKKTRNMCSEGYVQATCLTSACGRADTFHICWSKIVVVGL